MRFSLDVGVCAAALSLAASAVTAHSHAHAESDTGHMHLLPRDNSGKRHLFHRRQQQQKQTSYPQDAGTPTKVPAAWTAALQAAVQAGKIPNIPPTRSDGTYPPGTDAASPDVCNWTISHCFQADDVRASPAGHLTATFDDGPVPASPPLYDFLKKNSYPSTHFMIGVNVRDNPQVFQQALDINGHIAVHTWSHPAMTTKTNAEVVAELGWTMQIIYDKSGFVPAYWRPPTGDVDNRVRAIAKEVFGLTNVLWNDDTSDWCLQPQGGSVCPDVTLDKVRSSLRTFLTQKNSKDGPLILEHELSSQAISAFIDTFPLRAQNGWTSSNVADMLGQPWYQNAATNSKATATKPSDILPAAVKAAGGSGSGASSPGKNSTSSSSGSSSSSSSSNSTSSTDSAKSKAGNAAGAAPTAAAWRLELPVLLAACTLSLLVRIF